MPQKNKLPLKWTATLLFFIAFSMATAFVGRKALAAKPRASSYSSSSENESPRRSSRSGYDMSVDVTANYVRDTKPDGGTDSAGRFSVGGMFTEWMGLDFQALYEVRSESYLVGADIRIVPIEWLFIKGGFGGYSHKITRELSLSPLASVGIIVHLPSDFYFLTEVSTFNVNDRNKISFGAGLGARF